MSDDIKLPEPAGYGYESKLDDIFPYFTADQLRAAVLADRAERKAEHTPNLKKERGSFEHFMKQRYPRQRLNKNAGVYFYAIPNAMWNAWIERAHGIVEKESANG